MTRGKIAKWLFKTDCHIDFRKLVIVFAGFILFVQVLKFTLSLFPSELYHIKELTVEDVDFTDIYYKIGKNTGRPGKDVVLVNIGCYPDSIRFKLIDVIKALNTFEPNAIGVDMFFTDKNGIPDPVNFALDSLLSQKNIVIGVDRANQSFFPIDKNREVNFGCINLPGAGRRTVREYYYANLVPHVKGNNPVESFANKLYNVGAYNTENEIREDSTYIIRYGGSEKGFYNVFPPDTPSITDSLHDFPAIEAKDLLEAGSQDKATLKYLIHKKTVIIGWLGMPAMDAPYDINDKHRVPGQLQLFNRMPVMPGAVVNANALQTLINKDEIKKIDGWQHTFILYATVFLFLLALMAIDMIRPIGIKLIVEIAFLILGTLFLIRLSIFLMEHGYHLKIGKILLYLAILVEYKIFAIELQEYLERKQLRVIFRRLLAQGVELLSGENKNKKR